MFSKVSLGIAVAASLAGGGGALAANGQAIFSSSRPDARVAASVSTSQSGTSGQSASGGLTVTTPTVPRGTLTIVVTPPASASATSSSSLEIGAGDPSGADLAIGIVSNLQSVCPSLSSLMSSATNQLAALPTASSAVFQVTATEMGPGGSDTHATLLVDTRANSVTSTDALTSAALSTCARVANLAPRVDASGALTFAATG